MRPKTYDARRASDTRIKTTKFQTGIYDPGHLSCLLFDTQDPYQNPIEDTATRFQKYILSDVKAQDLNSKGQEKPV